MGGLLETTLNGRFARNTISSWMVKHEITCRSLQNNLPLSFERIGRSPRLLNFRNRFGGKPTRTEWIGTQTSAQRLMTLSRITSSSIGRNAVVQFADIIEWRCRECEQRALMRVRDDGCVPNVSVSKLRLCLFWSAESEMWEKGMRS